MTKRIYYSVSNGGDGSAYPHFMESARIAEMDQELMHEGWGESCTGYIEIEGDNIQVITRIQTEADFLEDLKERLTDKYYAPFHEQIKKFIEELETNEIDKS